MKKLPLKAYRSGQAMLIAVIFFMVISLTMVLGIALPIMKQVKASTELVKAKETYYLAEGAIEDAFYRTLINKTIGSGDTVSLGSSTATITVTNTISGKIINALATIGGRVRVRELEIIKGTGISFNYGIQSGTGGFIISNSAGVNGNVYSNGDIIGDNGAFISGTAVAANSAALTANQINGSTGVPPNDIVFRNTITTQDMAQSFQISSTGQVNKVRLYLKKVGTPTNATIRILNDSSGTPGTLVLDSGTLSASTVTTNYGWAEATFSSNAELVAGTTYWLVIENGGSYNASNYYTIGGNTSYALGTAKIGRYSTRVWSDTTPSGLDMYFELYLGGLTSRIENVDVGTGSTGDAWANNITESTIAGTAYCKTGSLNNKACNTTRQDPPAVPYSISDANIDQWKQEALAGGEIAGNYTVSGSVTLGPKKINGNLIVNGTLTITGNLWVTGTITGSNGAIIKLSAAYANTSGIIIADGYIDVSNNMQFQGVAGQPNTYILLLTTNACPFATPCAPNNSAIYLGNNAGAVILNAQKGTLHLKNGSGASEATAYTIELDPNAIINYSTGLASQVFSSGPSGGYSIVRWQEVQ
jgi:hypothetical protein